jgi:hypothetical protein
MGKMMGKTHESSQVQYGIAKTPCAAGLSGDSKAEK